MTKIINLHFEILGVTRKSSSLEIKAAYKAKIKKIHPDLFLNEKDKVVATRKTQLLVEAFETLKNYNPPRSIYQPTKSNDLNKSTYTNNFKQKKNDNCNWEVIERMRVKSSNVYAIGYDYESKTLIVEFKSNRSVYLYFNVPTEIYIKFMNADSKGQFMGHIYRYKYERVY